MANSKPLALVDMDLTIVAWESRCDVELARILPKEVFEKRNPQEYWIQKQFGDEHHSSISEIFLRQGFFLNLPPIEGALQGVQEMIDEGIDVMICSTPLENSEHCIPEKKEWLEKHLGKSFAERARFPLDKTQILGDVLIDDRLDIQDEGEYTAKWTQIVFDAYHNRHVKVPYRLKHWRNWKRVVLPILEHKLKSPR